MKSTNYIYHSLEELQENLDLSNLNSQKTLIQIFSGLIEYVQVEKIQAIFNAKNPNVNFLGVTTAGEILDATAHRHSIVVSITEFEHTFVNIHTFYQEKNDFILGQTIANTVFMDNTKACILFMESLNTNCSDVLSGLSSINSDIPMAGGLAGDYGLLKHPYIFDNQQIYDRGCIVASLNSDVLHVQSSYQLNWEPIGKVMEVTKVDKKRLYEIDNLSIRDLYIKYFGKEVANKLPFIAEEFPLFEVRDNKREMFHFFTKFFDEDGSVLTVVNLKKGDKVQLSFGNAFFILNKTIENLKQIDVNENDVLFIYNCAARKRFLDKDINLELEPFKRFATSSGFYCHGEICSSPKEAFILNMSLTYLILNETCCKNPLRTEEEIQYTFTDNKRYFYTKALVNLTNQIINELELAKTELHNQANRDYLTGLYNRRYLDKVVQELMVICQQEQQNIHIITLDIDNFKRVNDTYGHAIGDEVIKTLAMILKRYTRKNDVIFRLGGEEFGVLLSCATDKETFQVAEKLRKIIASTKVYVNKDEYIHFTISLGIDKVNFDNDISIYQALDRADIALYEAKRSGKNCTVVYQLNK